MFEQVFGFPAQTFLDSLEAISPDFARYIMEWEFADTYSRTALNPRERELVVLAACAALGATGAGPLKLHIEAARRLFAMSQPISGTIVEAYLRERDIPRLHGTGSLRFHPRCCYRPDEPNQPRHGLP